MTPEHVSETCKTGCAKGALSAKGLSFVVMQKHSNESCNDFLFIKSYLLPVTAVRVSFDLRQSKYKSPKHIPKTTMHKLPAPFLLLSLSTVTQQLKFTGAELVSGLRGGGWIRTTAVHKQEQHSAWVTG